MVQYLGAIELGALYRDGVAQPRSTKPWRISSEPYTGAGVGDIADFSTLQDMEKWVLGDTPADASRRLRWHKIQNGEKTLLICDRVILVNVSWDDLHSKGLIIGKDITIDGQRYKIRSLTGGTERREGGTGSSYEGGKLPNEWDQYVVNELNIAGMPVPIASDLDTTLNATDKNSVHNQFWNWMGVYSWCQDTYIHNTALRASRGYVSARHFNYYTSSTRYVVRGWRPVLEILNSAPLISGQDENLGEKNTPFGINYTVVDPDGDEVNVVEKLNGSVINTRNNVGQDIQLTLSIDSATFQGLEVNQQHTIIIEATDSENQTSTRTYTFTKTASPIAISGEDRDFEERWKAFAITYQVSDLNGKVVSVVEKVNETIVRNINAAPQNTDIIFDFESLFQNLNLNTQHVITITATNADGAIATRTYTFIKIDDRLKFNLFNPIATSAPASKIVLNLIGTIPSGTSLTIKATNNAFDDEPMWEDITENVLNKKAYYFTNIGSDEMNYGVNIEIEILKNEQSQSIYIDGFGLSFE